METIERNVFISSIHFSFQETHIVSIMTEMRATAACLVPYYWADRQFRGLIVAIHNGGQPHRAHVESAQADIPNCHYLRRHCPVTH